MNPEQEALRAKLITGLYSLATLPPADRALLAAMLRPPAGGFTPAQREMMEGFYLVAPSIAVVDTINQARAHRLAVRLDLAGRSLVSVDALTDIRPGETFAHAAGAIAQWAIVRVEPAGFPVEEE